MRAFYFILDCFVYSLNNVLISPTSIQGKPSLLSTSSSPHIKFNNTALQYLDFKRTGKKGF